MANTQRRPGESEQEFRRRQKIDEVEEYLALAGSTVEEFLKNPRWKTNRNGNLVFQSILTIRPTYGGKFGYVIGGAQATFSDEGYKSQEEAQRALWDAMQQIVEYLHGTTAARASRWYKTTNSADRQVNLHFCPSILDKTTFRFRLRLQLPQVDEHRAYPERRYARRNGGAMR